ncbi:MAG: glycosyltransferase family 4 protein [Clostridium sp.]|uniref:glycosyltransferase family 4 protein n=1 Tax=Clostridium sp. TaxID=1506 RepID=UPI003F3AD1F1
MKKKVLHVAQSNGGVSEYLKMFFKYSDANKFENYFIASGDYVDDKEKFERITEKIDFITMTREISFKKDIRAIYELYKLINEIQPDIIYAHSSKAGALVRLANIFIGKPLIYNAHGWSFNMKTSNIKRKIYYIIEKLLSYQTKKIICISEYEAETARQIKLCDNSKIRVIFNGIDIEKYTYENIDSNGQRKHLGIPENAYVIGMVGRISKQKAPDIFVKVAKEMKKQIENAFFIIVGDGDEREAIEESIKREKLEDCFMITGWVDNPDEYIRVFDIATLLSRWEGFGLVIAEYMALKKPIVSTEVDAIPNLITHNYNGFLAKVDDVSMICRGINNIRNNKEFKEKIVDNAHKIVNEKFDIKETVKKHEMLFNELVEESNIQ